MNIKSYITITAAVFSAVALLHLMRIILGESVIIGGWDLARFIQLGRHGDYSIPGLPGVSAE